MKIIIPMSGVGKRFSDAGYKDPKPLIDVDGTPMIYHVIDLFSEEINFHFICNEIHTSIQEILLKKVPTATITTVSNENRKGPVHAVSFIFDSIDDNEEVIVSYCDYGTVWDYKKFLEEMRTNKCDGGIASYIGFHPHMLGSDNYAFMKHENLWVTNIQEKQPFTSSKMEEYASNGTYYFKTGAILKKYFQKLMDLDMNIKGEYYVSLVYKLMIQDNLKVRIFEIEKMLQWGTPKDLEEYLQWYEYFKSKKNHPLEFRGTEDMTLILPMAGAGSRFKMVGYDLPKPLLPIENDTMVLKAVESLPPCKKNVFICLEEHLKNYPTIETTLKDKFNANITKLNNITQGQACTCEYGLENIKNDEAILISACDNGAYYDVNKFYKMIDDHTIDVIVWSFTNNPTSKLYPHMYAWLDVDNNGNILDVSIKKQFSDRDAKHCIIGTMFFRTKQIYMEGLQEIYSKNLRTNGEYYVDNLLVPLIQKGYKVKVFEVKNYLCWGTPNDYKTYNYWNEHFNKNIIMKYDNNTCISNYLDYVKNVFNQISFKKDIIISSSDFSFKKYHDKINCWINLEHILVKPNGRSSDPNCEINNGYLIRIDNYDKYNSNDYIIEYSIPNIIHVNKSKNYNLHNKQIYIPPMIYEFKPYNMNRNIDILTTFLDLNQERRKVFLNKVIDLNLPVKNINTFFDLESNYNLLQSTKILINIHQTDHHHTFEELRCLPALLNGVIIISEDCPYKEYIPYHKYIIWSSYDNIINVVSDVYNNYDKYYNEIFINSLIKDELTKIKKDTTNNIKEKLNFALL